MFDFRRTHHCGQLTKKEIGENVTLSGWVHRRRDHGGLIFIDLRDRFGLTQLVFNPELNPSLHEAANKLRAEWVISAKGKVIARREGMTNSNLPTGDIEIEVAQLEVLSTAKTPPFSICDERIEVNEELRLRYRYLDIRRGDVAHKLVMRHKAMMATRHFLDSLGFLEIVTPILAKSTPEGARDYLVPSRIYPGQFYALPQSPQIFKQLLMVAGMDRYFQIATCFRDEDLRADRQPEFAQIDMEMSFATQEEIFTIVEGLMGAVFKKCLHIDLPTPFRRVSYKECQEKYGTDKPDLRFGMSFSRLDDIAARSDSDIFTEPVRAGGTMKGFCVDKGEEISRKSLDEYVAFVTQFGVKGVAWMRQKEGALTTGVAKFFSPELQKEIIDRMGSKEGDLLLMIADPQEAKVNQALDHLRRRIAREKNLIDPNRYELLFVTDFPLFKWDEETQRIESEHHPFTSPLFEDLPLLETEPLKVRSSSYDLVLNGYELASGSQRIHARELQKKIFECLQLTEEEIKAKFGFFIEALSYGTPPHIGIALGFDRMVMILTQTENIRDVIAFPKTQKASDLMMEAPSAVTSQQLDELKLSLQIIK